MASEEANKTSTKSNENTAKISSDLDGQHDTNSQPIIIAELSRPGKNRPFALSTKLSGKKGLSGKDLPKASFAKLTIKCKYDFTKVKSFSGDDFYEQKLKLVIEKKQKQWLLQMRDAIEVAMDEHMTNCAQTITLLNHVLEGWQLTPSFVVDVSFIHESIQHFCCFAFFIFDSCIIIVDLHSVLTLNKAKL